MSSRSISESPARVVLPYGRGEIVRSVLAPFASRIDHVDVFGSHATGRARDNSDIDLVIHGRLEPGDVDRLWTLFSESRLPVTVDVIAYNLPLYAPLKRHIDEVAKRLFDHGDLLDGRSPATP